MKNILLLLALLFSTATFCQVAPGEHKGWPSIERYGFIKSCVDEAKSSMSEDSARFYCYCMQDKMESMYPNLEDAAKVTEDDMNNPAWQKMIRTCLGGFWSSAERNEFLNSCTPSAIKSGLEEEKARNYCECMLYKIEMKFPNPMDAAEIDEKTMASPEWLKLAKSCLDF